MLRIFFVTPDMHLVHHSVIVAEQKTNFGFALSIWDRLFGAYCAVSNVGADNQKIGLSQFEDRRPSTFVWSMKQPLT
jgi:sterol desaturase/sphingolipid hydroxylase (fatty acid hydroxylase superfamily)